MRLESLEDRLTPSTVTPYETPITVDVNNLIPSPSGPVTYNVSFLDPLQAIQQQYGLTAPDIAAAFNLRGQDEKYLQSQNGGNAANGGYYLLMPDGELFAWNSVSVQSSTMQAPIASLGVSVYENPLLLTDNTGAPIVSGANPLVAVKTEFGLATPKDTAVFNQFGGNEKWLHSSNGSNAVHGGWYLLLPNDTLVAWDGTLRPEGSLAADLSDDGNVYANPLLLTSAELPILPNGVTDTVDPSHGMLMLTPQAGFDRNVQVMVMAVSGSQTGSETFTLTVTDSPPTVPAVGPQTVAHNAALAPFNLGASGSGPLTYTTEVAGDNTLYDVRTEFGLTEPDIASAFNMRGGQEKYFHSTNGGNDIATEIAGHFFNHGGYYVLVPTGQLYAWDGVSLGTTTTSGNLAADLGAYGAYADTALLYNAQPAPIPVVFSNQGVLYDVSEQFGLNSPDLAGAFNLRGGNEKYFHSSNGSNAANGGYYLLMPDGLLYAWDGFSLATTVDQAPVANLSSEGVFADSALLYDAQPTVVNDPIYALKEQLGLYTADIASDFNKFGMQEKYFASGNGSNAGNGGLYVLLPDNDLYAWDGHSLGSTITTTPVAQFMTGAFNNLDVYDNTLDLYSDMGQTLAVTATADSSGNLTILQNPYFVGTAGITAAASDGAESTSQSFLFTSTNAVPTIPTLGPVTVPHGATVPPVAIGASDVDSDPLTYTATVSADNPLYDIQTEFGLNQPDIAAAFNMRHGDERYFQSTNGSNPTHQGYYVLMPAGILYAWDGVSLATTATSANQVADPGTEAYLNTAFLYKAQPPASPTVEVNRGPLYDIREQFGLTEPDIAAAFNARGGDEKYLQSTSGGNPINGGYYVLTPDGDLYAWDGISLATTTTAANLVAEPGTAVYTNPSLLYDALPAFINDPLFAVKDQFGLTQPDIASVFNQFGMQEKYFVSTNGSNPAGGGTYVLLPDGDLFAWTGTLSGSIAKDPVADLSGEGVYANTALLTDSTGRAPAVTVSVDSTGKLTITPNTAFDGTVLIDVMASDGLATTAGSFPFTVTDGAPVLPAVDSSAVPTSSHSATINLNATDSAGKTNDLQFAATVTDDDPLYNLKEQYGLTQPDIAAAFDMRGGDEKYFQSTNGSNAAHDGYYVLTTDNRLYAWDGVSLATTAAQTPIADLTYFGVYNDTALLYNASPPATPPVTAIFTNTTSGGTINLSWPATYTGTFITTVTIGDGAQETQQSFILPYNAPIITDTLPVQTVSASSSPTQVDLAGYFSDENTTDSEVTFNITNATVPETLNVTLFDTTAPQTVANFLDYVRSGDYTNSIFTRLMAGFVLQGGGLALNSAGNGLTAVPLNPAVPNEFGPSNVADTIAMALFSGNINSGTNQYYFNLVNNSASLDPQHFTVFGQLADSASDSTLATLAETSVTDESHSSVAAANPAVGLSNLPLTNYSGGSSFPAGLEASNLMVINSIAIDKQTEFLTYTATSSNPSLVTASTRDEWLTLNYVPGQTGSSTITVTATDLYGFTITQSFTVTVNAVPPTVDSVIVTPDNVNAVSTLTAHPTGTDLQDKPISYAYQWFNGTSPISGATTATLSLALAGISAGNQITVQVTPSDGTLTGSAFTSNAITIATTGPFTIAPATITSVVIVPNSATATTALTAQPTATTDPLGLPLYGAYQWLQNGNPIAGANSATLSLLGLSVHPGDIFSVEVTASDGYLTSPAFFSKSAQVATASPITLTPPSINTVTIASDNTSNATKLTGTITSNNPAAYSLQWYQNGSPITNANSLTLSLSSLTVGTGDTFQLKATPVEGALQGSQVSSNTITVTGVSPIQTSA